MKKYMFFLLLTSFYVQAMEKEKKNNDEDHGFIGLQEVYLAKRVKTILPGFPHGPERVILYEDGTMEPIFIKQQVKKLIEVQNNSKKNNDILLP